MRFNIKTFSLTALSRMTFSIKAFSIKAFSITTPSIMTFNIKKFSGAGGASFSAFFCKYLGSNFLHNFCNQHLLAKIKNLFFFVTAAKISWSVNIILKTFHGSLILEGNAGSVP